MMLGKYALRHSTKIDINNLKRSVLSKYSHVILAVWIIMNDQLKII